MVLGRGHSCGQLVILQKCQVSCTLLLAVGRLDISTSLGSGKIREESTVFTNVAPGSAL